MMMMMMMNGGRGDKLHEVFNWPGTAFSSCPVLSCPVYRLRGGMAITLFDSGQPRARFDRSGEVDVLDVATSVRHEYIPRRAATPDGCPRLLMPSNSPNASTAGGGRRQRRMPLNPGRTRSVKCRRGLVDRRLRTYCFLCCWE